MGWSIGYDDNWHRDIGYGVPAYCDHPECNAEIDRGLAYVCCGEEPYGGEGCGLFFCPKHQDWEGKCGRCSKDEKPFDAKPDHPRWIKHKLEDASWGPWRADHRNEVKAMRAALAASPPAKCQCGAVPVVRGLCFDCWRKLAAGAPMPPERAPVPAVDPSRSTPNAVAPPAGTERATPTENGQ